MVRLLNSSRQVASWDRGPVLLCRTFPRLWRSFVVDGHLVASPRHVERMWSTTQGARVRIVFSALQSCSTIRQRDSRGGGLSPLPCRCCGGEESLMVSGRQERRVVVKERKECGHCVMPPDSSCFLSHCFCRTHHEGRMNKNRHGSRIQLNINTFTPFD